MMEGHRHPLAIVLNVIVMFILNSLILEVRIVFLLSFHTTTDTDKFDCATNRNDGSRI